MQHPAINKTHLDVEKATERGLIHRDYASHYFRWSVVLRYAHYQDSVGDVGCNDGMLAQILYVNKYKPKIYVGFDILRSALEKLVNRQVNFPIKAICVDLREKSILSKWKNKFDLVTSFECVEHFEKFHIHNMLDNVSNTILHRL